MLKSFVSFVTPRSIPIKWTDFNEHILSPNHVKLRLILNYFPCKVEL